MDQQFSLLNNIYDFEARNISLLLKRIKENYQDEGSHAIGPELAIDRC